MYADDFCVKNRGYQLFLLGRSMEGRTFITGNRQRRRKMNHRVKRMYQTYKELFLLGLLGIPIGLVIGGIDAVFGRVLLGDH